MQGTRALQGQQQGVVLLLQGQQQACFSNLLFLWSTFPLEMLTKKK